LSLPEGRYPIRVSKEAANFITGLKDDSALVQAKETPLQMSVRYQKIELVRALIGKGVM